MSVSVKWIDMGGECRVRGKKYTEFATVAPGDTHAESGVARRVLAGSATSRRWKPLVDVRDVLKPGSKRSRGLRDARHRVVLGAVRK